MNLNKNLSQMKFDTRMIDWNMTQKLISPKDVKKHLESLEDISHLAEKMQAGEPQK